MRIPEYHNNNYNLNPQLRKSERIKKVHKDQFENELEDSVNKRKREAKTPSKQINFRKTKHQKIRSTNKYLSNWG